MKQSILRFCISISFFAISFSGIAQNTEKDLGTPIESVNDTVKKSTQTYSLRLGIDISKPIISIFNDDFIGLEIVGDLKVKKNMFIATEIGYTDVTDEEDFLIYNTKGSYIKVGGNYNFYKNTLKFNNEIYIGFRYGLSSFSQTLVEYTPNYYGTYFSPPTFTPNTEVSGLTAHWGELVLGLKVETLKNFFIGASMSVKKLFNQEQPDNFQNLYIPGYERVYLNNTGFSFNYTLSYSIPLFKKIK